MTTKTKIRAMLSERFQQTTTNAEGRVFYPSNWDNPKAKTGLMVPCNMWDDDNPLDIRRQAATEQVIQDLDLYYDITPSQGDSLDTLASKIHKSERQQVADQNRYAGITR